MGICYERLVEECKNLPVTLYGKYNGITESGKIYRNTDILYCSYNPNVENWKNAYPVKLYEAIITLTPIIVSKGTKVGEFVKQFDILKREALIRENRLLIERAKNETGMYRAISENYEKYVENLREIQNNYQWETVTKNLKQIYVD